MLFASYRRADYDDPDGFIASMGLIFKQYPEEVVVYVTRPETGIQRRIKFPPSIPEVVEACDLRVAELARFERFRNWGNPSEALAIEDRSRRLTLAELKAKYGENWGIGSETAPVPKSLKQALTAGELVEHYRHHGLGFKPKPATGEKLPTKAEDAA